jgi:hypothetical protein
MEEFSPLDLGVEEFSPLDLGVEEFSPKKLISLISVTI